MACKVDSCGKGVQWSGLCSVHYGRLRKYGDPLFMHDKECAECGGGFRAYHKSARVCSDECKKARERRRELERSALTCDGCAKPIYRGATSAPQGVARCLPCRRVHGSVGMYENGCRCEECRAAKAERMALFFDDYAAEHGVSYSVAWRRKFKAEHGFWPQGSGTEFVDAPTRRAIYERDGWICQLCERPIDPGATEHAKRASLDHVVPQSHGGAHDPANLRMAHVGCNAQRGNRVDDFEGVA